MASEENIAAGVFELRADGGQFRAEIANTTEVAKRFERSILESFNKAGTAASQTQALETASKRYMAAIEREAAAIERKTASLVLSVTEQRKAEAAARGESENAKASLARLEAAEKGYKSLSGALQQVSDINAFGELLAKSQSLGQVEKNIDALTASLNRLQGEARDTGAVRLSVARGDESRGREAADTAIFDTRANEAAKLNRASEYVQFWTRALDEADAKEKELADFRAFDVRLAEAAKLNRASEYVQFWNNALEQMEAQEREAKEFQAFEQRRLEAAKLRQASEYVQFWNNTLDQMEAKEKQTAGNNAFIAGLKGRSDAIGKTQADLLELQAAEKGLSDQAAPYIANLRAQEKTLGIYSGGARDARVSTNQLRVAMQQLPAQFTDVFTSLAGGQNPLLVLIQQGGQIKDSFGGIGNALKGIGSAIATAFTPVGVAVTAVIASVGALGAALVTGEKEATAYRVAIALTGNAAGTTVTQLNESAQAIARTVGTQAKAAETLAALAATGRVAGADLRLLAEAAIRLEREGGPAIKDTVAAFAELGKNPTQGALKLNETVRFLTVSVLEQIKALEDQGRTTDAARVAQVAYANEAIDRARDLEKQLGSLSRGWREVADGAKKAWDAVLNVGRQDSLDDAIAQMTEKVRRLRLTEVNAGVGKPTEFFLSLTGTSITQQAEEATRVLEKLFNAKRTQEALAKQKADTGELTIKYNEAAKEVKKWGDASLTSAEKAQKAIEKYRNEVVKPFNQGRRQAGLPELSPEEQAKQEKAIRDSFVSGNKAIKERDGTLESARAAARKWADEIVGFQKIQMDSVAATEHMTSAERALAEILRDPAWEARSQSQKQLTIDSFLAAQAAIERAKAEKDAAKAIEDAAKAEDKRRVSTVAMQKSVADYVKSIDATVEFTRLEQSLANESQRARQVAIEQFQVELDLRQKIADINATDVAGTPDQAADIRAQAIADAQAAAAIAKANISSRAIFDPPQLDAASAAVKDYLDEIGRAGQATQDATRQTMNLLEDDIVQSLARGKFDVKKTIDYMIAEFLRLQIVRPMMKDLFGSGSGGIGSLFSAFINWQSGNSGVGGFDQTGGGVGFAMGGAFSSSGPIPLASGGVVSGATPFSAGGQRYVMAEAGPEAVMPLKRGSDGKLGVAASGSAPTIVNNMTVNGDVSPQTVALMNATLAKNNAALIRGMKTGTIGVN